MNISSVIKVNFRRLWQYTLAVAVPMLVVGIAIDQPDVSQYARKTRQYMADGNYAKALEVGSASDKTDQRLMMLRVEALGHEKLLGERLFAYPLKGRSGNMAQRGGDYALCAYLIDKNLDRFVAELPKYYQPDGPLPRYYREALVLYNHLRTHPRIVFHDNVMDTDYADLQQLERQYSDPRERQMAVFKQYKDTYWYYYDYLNGKPARR
jgi:hypothetical protein